MESEKWEEVARVGRDEEASLIAGFLQAEGIEVAVENRKFHMEPVNFGALTGIRILVPESAAASARTLLEKRRREFEDLRGRGDEESILTDEGPGKAPAE